MSEEVKTEIERTRDGVVLTVRKGPKFVRITMTREQAGRMAAELAVAAFPPELLNDAAPLQTRIRL
jgi:monoamine oxidase